MDHNAILQNRATRTEAAPEEMHCTMCGEPMVFGMRDNYHAFSLGLTTVLECMYAAEQKGCIPPLADAWWADIEAMYHLHLHLLEEDAHGCVQAEDDRSGAQKHRKISV